MADVQTDASSASSTPEPISASDALASLSDTERAMWQKSGALPDRIQSPHADSTPAEPVEQVASTDAPVEAAASEPAKPVVEKPKGAKARNAELDAEIAQLQEKLKLRAALREELDRPAGTKDVKAAESSPASALPIDPSDPKPDPSKYDGGEFDATYLHDVALWSGRESSRALRLDEKRERDAAFVVDAQTRVLDGGRKAHDDFDAALTAAEADGLRFSQSMTDAMFREPELGHELAYVLATDRALFTRIAALPLPLQEREIGKVLGRLSSPAAPKAEPLKTLTDNPEPPLVLGSRPATSPDAVDNAIRRKDAGAYIREANARELAAKR